MLLKGLEGTFAYVPRNTLVASEVSDKYREIEEVGSGSYG
jgi:hypothetical protein